MEELRIEGAAFDKLREGINQCLKQVIFKMVGTNMKEGSVSASIKIEIDGEPADAYGEVILVPRIDCSVGFNVPYKATMRVNGPVGKMIRLRDGCSTVMIEGPEQVSMFEQEGEEQQ